MMMNAWMQSLVALSAIASDRTAFVESFANSQLTTRSAPFLTRIRDHQPLPISSLLTTLHSTLCPECETETEISEIPNIGGDELLSFWKEPSEHEEKELSSTSLSSGPDLHDVTISFLQDENGQDKSYPLVISPRHDSSLQFLTKFMAANGDWVNNMMTEYGAVLVRDFDIYTAPEVEQAIQSFQPELSDKYRGTSPRNVLEGTKYVFHAAEVPANFPIAQHLEMSFLPAPPKQLYFSALKAPKVAGGETALADFRKVYQDIPLSLREKLSQKKILYERTHTADGIEDSNDVASRKGWKELFGTESKDEVERLSKEENMPMRWTGKNNDVFVSEFTTEPFQLHPVTNEPVWFNHAQVFHWSTFPAELFLAFHRTKDLRYLARAIMTLMVGVVNYGLLRKKMALNVSFGDGTPISFWEMQAIRRAIHKNMVFNRWKEGDILMIDNFSTSHGRQPTYDSGRKVVVAWSDPLLKSDKPVTEEVITEWQ